MKYNVVPLKLHITLLYEFDIDVHIGRVYFTKCFATLRETGSKLYFDICDFFQFKENGKEYDDCMEEQAVYHVAPIITNSSSNSCLGYHIDSFDTERSVYSVDDSVGFLSIDPIQILEEASSYLIELKKYLNKM